ncbi:MAG: hypothetical protein N2Z22_04375, partial [Turneriella sp.]|nr:hypothetical protein [Turneriella sp.]
VTASGGAVTGCSAISGGNDYMVGQVVSIGGAAVLRGDVNAAGNLTGMTVINSGCGYTAAPTITVQTGAGECATAGSYTAVLTSGRVTSVTVTTQATGCPRNPTIILSNPTHGDGATAVVQNVTAASGRVVAVSISPPAVNLAQLLANTEKSPLNAAVNYNGTGPNISAREAMVRLLHHGVDHTSPGYLTANGGAFTTSTVSYPGIGPVHTAQNVLNNLSSAGSVMTIINLLNSNSTSMTDLVVLIGCGDHVEYARVAPLTNNDFHAFCSGHNPNLW